MTALLRHWGLIEEHVEKREDGGRAGVWRVTLTGEAFLLRHGASVPQYAVVYNDECLRLEGEQVTIRDALGSAFDYDELMNTYAQDMLFT